MKKVLVVIDMQNDFIDGSLGSEAAKAIVPKVAEKIRNFDGPVILTKDTHRDSKYLDSLEGKKLPVKHCIKGTPGHDFAPAIEEAIRQKLANTELTVSDDDSSVMFMDGEGVYITEKNTFGSCRVTGIIDSHVAEFSQEFEIEICGLCTDICVVSNALMLRASFPDVPITVLKDCCAGTSKEAHEAALTVMLSCQIDVA